MMGPVDQMEMLARQTGMTQDEFAQNLNAFMNGPQDLRTYVIKTPDWCLLAREVTPEIEPMAPGPAWVVYFYTGVGLKQIITCVESGLGPALPYVGFSRPLRGRKKLQFFEWERIKRLCEHF